jgi:hypothetical protein
MGQLKNLNLLNKTVLFIFQLLSELKCSQKRAQNGLKTDRTGVKNASNRLRIANFGLRIEAQKAGCVDSRRSLPRTPIRAGNDGGVVRSAFGDLENWQTGETAEGPAGEPENRKTAGGVNDALCVVDSRRYRAMVRADSPMGVAWMST